MVKDQVYKALDSVKDLTTPPTILREILGLLNNPDISNKELTQVILKDPSLTVRLIKIANSSYYGLSREVTSVNQAIIVIGLKAVKYYILSITVFNQITTKNNHNVLDQRQLWLHFLETAVASRMIAERTKYEMPEEAYVAGLLHDIGIILLECNFPKEYKQVADLIASGETLCRAENIIFGLDHQDVAGYITQKWNMPEKLCEPLRNHHHIDNDSAVKASHLTKVIALADSIAQVPIHELNSISSSEQRLISLNILSGVLNLDDDTLMEIHQKLASEVLNSASQLDLDMGNAIEILTQSNTKLFGIYLELASLFKERQELSREALMGERTAATLESLHISLATLSHYLNNAVMNIQGKCEIMNMYYGKQDLKALVTSIPGYLDSILKSTTKIMLLMQELSEISSLDKLKFFGHSKAIDIESDLKAKLAEQFDTVEK